MVGGVLESAPSAGPSSCKRQAIGLCFSLMRCRAGRAAANGNRDDNHADERADIRAKPAIYFSNSERATRSPSSPQDTRMW